MRRYAEDSEKRLAALRDKDEAWWEGETTFFDVRRSRAWVLTRRIAHTAHHRGQQLAMLRMLGRDEHSNYGPTADTGGLMQNHAPDHLPVPKSAGSFRRRSRRRQEDRAARPRQKPVTERPDSKD